MDVCFQKINNDFPTSFQWNTAVIFYLQHLFEAYMLLRIAGVRNQMINLLVNPVLDFRGNREDWDVMRYTVMMLKHLNLPCLCKLKWHTFPTSIYI